MTHLALRVREDADHSDPSHLPLILSVPEAWIPCLYGQRDLPETLDPRRGSAAARRVTAAEAQAHRAKRATEALAMQRWLDDLRASFGPVYPLDVQGPRTFDPCHEGTEWGAAPAWCRDVVFGVAQ